MVSTHWHIKRGYWGYCDCKETIARSFSPFLPQLHHLQLWPQSISDPFDALLLWVNDEWPTLTGGQDGSILGGHPIIWQALVMPGSHSGIVCNHEDWIQAVCQGYRDLEQKSRNDVTLAGALGAKQQASAHRIYQKQEQSKQHKVHCKNWSYLLSLQKRDPCVVKKLDTILPGKVPHVGDKCWCEQDITIQGFLLLFILNNSSGPALLLWLQDTVQRPGFNILLKICRTHKKQFTMRMPLKTV